MNPTTARNAEKRNREFERGFTTMSLSAKGTFCKRGDVRFFRQTNTMEFD